MDLHGAGILVDGCFERGEEFALIFAVLGFEEVNHDDAAAIAQADLARGFAGCFNIDVQMGSAAATFIDVDGGERGGTLNDDVTSAW